MYKSSKFFIFCESYCSSPPHSAPAKHPVLNCTCELPVQTRGSPPHGNADPLCIKCGGQLKVATVLFGEDLAADDLSKATRAFANCDLLLVVGSTLNVSPIAQILRTNRGPIGGKTEKPKNWPKTKSSTHIAIEGVLVRRECAETYFASK